MRRRFPPGMLLGVATSATQIEGGCPPSDWGRFAAEAGRIAGGGTPERACDHWGRWSADVELLRELQVGAYRLGVEWARIEPERGHIDRAALDQYRALLGAVRDAGVEPMVTLHHFTLPLWVADKGGLRNPELPALLTRLARTVAEALGDLCSWWITVNEPNVVSAQGYLSGEWPPGRSGDVAGFIAAQRNLLEAHVGMYRVLHDEEGRMPGPARVGVAHHLRVIEPERRFRLGDRAATWAMRTAFNDAFAGALTDGKMTILDAGVRALGGFDPREARGSQDFFGINYYGRDLVSLRLSAKDEGFVHRGVPEGAPLSDLGWELYPEGLTAVATRWHERSGLPVVVTENGLADADDEKRPAFLVQHLDALLAAAERGVPVAGYFHWSLMDNFEWAEGYAPRFGLYAVDYETQERTLRPSGELYRELIRAGGISDEVRARYGR